MFGRKMETSQASDGQASENQTGDSYSVSTRLSGMSTMSNGLCSFNPTSTKGKWIFLIQTVFLSFTPILILLAQNSVMFTEMIYRRDMVYAKDSLMADVGSLAELIISLQRERSEVALSLYMSRKTADNMDLNAIFSRTDQDVDEVQWRPFSSDKIFSSKLRFQIKLDDFREMFSRSTLQRPALSPNETRNDNNPYINTVSEDDILNFYSHATGTLLNALESDIGDAQSSNNWRIIMAYFNLVKILESMGIGLVYGLKFYNEGNLNIDDMVSYVRHSALVDEYYKQVKELVAKDIQSVLEALYEGDGYNIVSSSSREILSNEESDEDHERGQLYFEGCTKFTDSLIRILNMTTDQIKDIREQALYDTLLAQVWGIFLLIVVLAISPVLVVLAKNAIFTIQVFAQSVQKKALDMKRQERKRNRLIYKMLPKIVVEKLSSGSDTAETFESVTLYFSTVAGFSEITNSCNAIQVVQFLNTLYTVMDSKMDDFDVYKVETISDSYLVASGLPKKNGDKHAVEVCNMALTLRNAASLIVRPDKRPQTIEIKAGIHSGCIVAGVVGSKMPRYCLFGDTINTASRMQSRSLPGKIQISMETKMMLDVVGGFIIENRGAIEVKGKGMLDTFWLVSHDSGGHNRA
ncbi:soluble guanylate cyclase gcy-37-like [Tigriopus californicus]|uniref:soluble guanylate cyclase gcy-37-like n=1 Tax=Tigriopus californicus TaxID=6832 RepID=UPI0027DA8582|nr:soluble guanylate cyclase gcy-37-like [Tigriopus californicus]